MKLSEYIRESEKKLSDLYPSEESRSLVRMVVEELYGTPYKHLLEPDFEMKENDYMRFSEIMDALEKGEPIQYILGHAEFYGRNFMVDRNVLIPRPETEILCSKAIEEAEKYKNKKLKILDLCCGSGCIAWTMAFEIPSSSVFGVDISLQALKTASGQFGGKIAGAPVFSRADILECMRGNYSMIPDVGMYDIIVSNPPYVSPEEKSGMRRNVLNYEPHSAIFAPEEDVLIFYKAILEISKRFLGKESFGLIEINDKFASETMSLFSSFYQAEFIKDFHGKNRFIIYRNSA